MKVALVYDRINKFGGAERVLLALRKIWPKAPLFTAVYDSKKTKWADKFKIVPSLIQKIPLAKQNHELYPWLMPFAFESFDFSKFDVVISVTSAEAKGIITKPETLHICYCLTPTRYLWSSFDHYKKNPQYGLLNPLANLLAKPLITNLRKWDKVACFRPDCYLAISKTVKKRIKKYYCQDSEIVYPPINLAKFKPKDYELNKKLNKKYFLVVSRLVSYKRVDIVVKAFNRLKIPLIIIGDGYEKRKLQRKAENNIIFLSQDLTDKQLLSYYQNCEALVFAGKEDFGLVSLEAQACGRPVIGYNRGGIAETVIDGKTGILFYPQTSNALVRAVKAFNNRNFKSDDCYQNAKKYDQKIFIKKFEKLVEEKWKKQPNQLA